MNFRHHVRAVSEARNVSTQPVRWDNARIKRMPCHVNQRQAAHNIAEYLLDEVVQVEDRLRLKTQLSGVTRVEPANIAGLREDVLEFSQATNRYNQRNPIFVRRRRPKGVWRESPPAMSVDRFDIEYMPLLLHILMLALSMIQF
jgi:hypothetical protein